MAPPKQPRKQPIVLRGDGEMREEWDGSGALMMTSDEAVRRKRRSAASGNGQVIKLT